jgi:hypothetical protein
MSVERDLRGLAASCLEVAHNARLLSVFIGVLRLAPGDSFATDVRVAADGGVASEARD